jgi:hypothetical protein
MKQAFKDKWLENITNGRFKRRRYGLSDGNHERCVLGAARSTAVDLGLLKDEDLGTRDLLTDSELTAIGLSHEAQHVLSTANDTYVSTSNDKFPLRIINMVKALPVEREPLLIELTVK